MLLLTKVKQFSNLLKIIIIRNKCYSVNCDFPIRYVNGCPESKILLKYPHWQLFIQTSQFYMGIWHKLLKSKHCYFFNITLPWMKIWRWRCSRYLKCEISVSKVQVHRSYSQKTFYEFSWNAQLCLIFMI